MMRVDGKRVPLLFMCAVLMLATVSSAFTVQRASAAQMTNRSLTLVSSGAVGGSTPGGVVRHQFAFTIPSNTSIGSLRFEYCNTAADVGTGTCVTPAGLVTTGATIDSQSGPVTGFSVHSSTASNNGRVVLTRAAATGTGAVTYRLANITNPTATNTSFYVRISTHASADGTGAATDTGSVVASTANQIQLTGIMPESLIFCTAEDITANASNVPDCSTATDATVDFNQLFSPSDTATAKSEIACSTNATFGYAITVHGTTLTSGSNTIAAMGVTGNPTTTSTKGIAQFGMNLVANTTATSTVAVGSAISPASDSVNLWGRPATGYSTPDNFKFESGNVVADSDSKPTNGQILTASYIVNVPGNQVAGTYTSTLTYIATATF